MITFVQLIQLKTSSHLSSGNWPQKIFLAVLWPPRNCTLPTNDKVRLRQTLPIICCDFPTEDPQLEVDYYKLKCRRDRPKNTKRGISSDIVPSHHATFLLDSVSRFGQKLIATSLYWCDGDPSLKKKFSKKEKPLHRKRNNLYGLPIRWLGFLEFHTQMRIGDWELISCLWAQERF